MLNRFPAAEDCVPGSLGFRLYCEADAVGFERGLHVLCLMPEDNDDLVGRRHSERGAHDMFHQRETAGAMQHFGEFRFHAGAETRREYEKRWIHLLACDASSMAMAAAAPG